MAVIMGGLPDGSALPLKGDVQLRMREYPRCPRLNSFMAHAVALVSRHPVLGSKVSGSWRWIAIRERFDGEGNEKPSTAAISSAGG
jgi:hypothetical protein